MRLSEAASVTYVAGFARLLEAGGHEAAGIDASIPAQFLRGRSHAELLATVARIGSERRQFASQSGHTMRRAEILLAVVFRVEEVIGRVRHERLRA
jgi:hypothetical protein